MFILISIFSIFFLIQEHPIHQTDLEGIIKVIDKEETLYRDVVTVRMEQKHYHIYTSKDALNLGDYYVIKGKLDLYRRQTTPFGFDLYHHYYAKGIEGKIEIEMLSFVKEGYSIYQLRSNMKDTYSEHQSKTYIMLFLFGESDQEDTSLSTYQALGLMFLLSFSGIHIYVILVSIRKWMDIWNISLIIQESIILLIVFVFLYLDRFQIGSSRLCIYYALSAFLRIKKIRIQKLDLLQLTFLILITMHFRWIYSTSAIILYLLFNVLYLTEDKFKTYGLYVSQMMTTLTIQLILLPFFRQTSLLLIMIMPWMMKFFSLIYTPLLMLVILLKPLDQLFFKMMSMFNDLLNFILHQNVSFSMAGLTIFSWLFYFFCLIFFLKSKSILKGMTSLLLIVMLSISIKLYHEQRTSLMFLDAGQGDSAIITDQGCVIVMDAYGPIEATLSSLGITEIDYLILSHSDGDHTKEAQTLIENFHIKKIVLSFYDDYNHYGRPTLLVKSGDHLTCKNIQIEILGPLKAYQKSNNQSIVLRLKLGQTTFLFTGDIEKEAEEDLANHYKSHLKSDVLKVAHHGSITSSSELFISYVRPTYAVISLGYQNRFDFPHPSVIQRLVQMGVRIYRTDLDGTIMYLPSTKKEKWIRYIPYPS